MPKDIFSNNRMKSRFIFEIRYEPLIQIFDRRGKILESIHDSFKTKMKLWRTENASVHITDDPENPLKQIAIDHLRHLIIYEDAASLEEFHSDTIKSIKLLKEVFPEGVKSITRMGVRFISFLEIDKYKSYDEIYNKFLEQFFANKIPASLNFTFATLSLEHESVKLNMSPIKQSNLVEKNAFSFNNVDENKFGFFIDVDGFAKDLECEDSRKLIQSFDTVFGLTQSTESEIISPFL